VASEYDMSNTFTKDSLAKLFRPISDLINGNEEDDGGLLDPAIRNLLKASTTLVPHSRDVRVLQFHIWARDQPSIFHRHHFKYAIQYDPFGTIGGTATKNFTVEFYVSKIRIYQEREQMVARVGRDLSRIRVPGFSLCETNRFFCFDHKFNASTEAALLREIRSHLFPLLNTVHPMFFRILDAFNLPLTKEQRQDVISGRQKLGFVDRLSPYYGKNPQYRREVSSALRWATFERDQNLCQHCERKFDAAKLHADHVVPVARGGLTVLGNLQALCGPCNLKKGKRLEIELPDADLTKMKL
jgi:5-methylcytosine-specific restriction endonuclease McrA